MYGECLPHYSTIKRWAAAFRLGRDSLEDDPRSGHPAIATSQDKIDEVQKLVLSDRRLKVVQIAAEVQLSVGSVYSILHEKLLLSKVSARWVPRNLCVQDRHQRVECCYELLDLYNANPEDFLCRLVTGDETWVHHWDPETKFESMQWKHKDSPPPKKFRTQPSAGKVMATVFWDSEGILMIDYMPHKTTITGQYYAQLMPKLREAIKNKRRGKLSHGVLILHDNAPVHKARVAQAAITECGFEQLNHPPYSPDLAPSDYFLFRNLKSHLRGNRYSNNAEIIHAVESYFDSQEKSFYLEGISSLKVKWQKCIDVRGDYIEK